MDQARTFSRPHRLAKDSGSDLEVVSQTPAAQRLGVHLLAQGVEA